MAKENIKAYIFTCETCGHEWLSKIECFWCPECKATHLIVEKLKS